MSIKTCLHCRAAYRGAPHFCTACGHELPRRHMALRSALGILAFVAIIGIVAVTEHPSHEPATEVASAPAPKPKPDPEEWQYSDATDGMGRRHWFAEVRSEALGVALLGGIGNTATLTVRSAHKNLLEDVYITVQGGQFLCDIRDCSVNVRFDGKPMRRFQASGEVADGSTNMLFILDVGGFIAQMRKARTVRIEAQVFREGLRTAFFRTEGFQW